MSKANKVIPQELPILPVRDTVLFPGAVLPLPVGRESSLALLNSLEGTEKILGVVAQLDPRVEAPTGTDLHSVGTLAKVHKMVRMPNGNVVAFLEGMDRIRVTEVLGFKPFLRARVELQPDLEDQRDAELTALERNVQELFREVVARSPQLSDDLQTEVMNIDSPGRLADFVTSTLPSLSTLIRQELLETFSVRKRLESLISELTKEREVLDLRNKIHDQVQEQVNQSQREFLLREQMKAIQKELGESDDGQAEIDELRKKVEESGMTAEAKKECDRELKRLAKMTPASAEYMVARTYLEWMTSLPWSKVSGTEDIDIPKAHAILNEDHYDLVKIKERILDYLAVKKLQPGMKGPILCFVGPPGVGKTSLGKSIARALGRKFVRISLGGMHDEAEIRGHRRTYIGALPGQIIQGIKRAETMDPVLMLDEVDKLGRDFRGDPSAALMEVLDPEQNSTFRDHYLDVPFDLSKVMFICTANWLDPIPEPLRDRMEIIELTGYTEEEKLQIAKRYLLARQLKANGLTSGQVEISEDALRRVIVDYTREAGVRSLERQIGALLRNSAVTIASGETPRVAIGPDEVVRILGAARFESDVALRTSIPGVATGLAWTPAGGDILFIESSRVRGSGKLILTGQLGEVMKESAQAAVTWVKSQADRLGIEPSALDNSDLHIHVPAGAIPKDGPSAGVAIATSLASLLSHRTVRASVAMTGEISLRGVVMPVGGIKEKCVAAARAGIRTVILPARNRRDLEDIPESVRAKLEFVWAEKIEDVLVRALDDAPAQRAAA